VKYATRKLRSPIKWHGGKSYLARRIIALFPSHRVYVEPFAGGLSVLLNKPQTGREVVGDLNTSLINFWVTLRDHPSLRERLDETEYNASSFASAKEQAENSCGIACAWAFLVRNRMSRGGLGKDFAWSERLRGKRRAGGPVPGELNAWDTIRSELPGIVERIQDVEIYGYDAVQLIRSEDAPGVLFYCDPPYCHETRTHKKAYAHEMSLDQHAELLSVLKNCQGKVILSGYANPLYDDVLVGWNRHIFEMPNHSGQGKTKQRRVEVLWESPAPQLGQPRPVKPLDGQMELFGE
jgi:DNA adenine methylase